MLWRNPIFIRFCRSELRVKKAIFWYLLILIVTAFTVALIYAPQVVNGRPSIEAARTALLPVMFIQGVILIFMGTGSVASGITREKVENVLNYQRLTPMPIREKIIGYLFGLPVRQYVLFAITLPFLVFVLVVGRVPPSAFIPYYLVFFTSALLYHLTGMVAGMISKRWRWSGRIAQGLVILLYFILPQLSHIGLVFLEFLTVRPVLVEHIIPLVGAEGPFRMEGIGFVAGQSVPFFTFQISGTLFSFIIQACLVALFAGIVSRKWKADSIPAISKPMALVTFALFAVMSLANIWPNLVRDENALQIFQSDGPLAAEAAVVALPMILALATTFLAYVLMTSALPEPMQYRHGRIRAARHLRKNLSGWEDDAGGYPLTFALYAIQSLLLIIVFVTLFRSGYFGEIESHPLWGMLILVATGLSLLSFQGLKENFGVGQLALFVLLGWTLPLLFSILIFAINQSLLSTALLVAALSPLTAIPLSTIELLPPDLLDGEFIFVQRALGVSILFLTLLNVWLHLHLKRWRHKLDS